MMVGNNEFQVATSNPAFAYFIAVSSKNEQLVMLNMKFWNIYISAHFSLQRLPFILLWQFKADD